MELSDFIFRFSRGGGESFFNPNKLSAHQNFRVGGKFNKNNSPPAEISRWRIELDGGELFEFLIQINSPSSTQVKF